MTRWKRSFALLLPALVLALCMAALLALGKWSTSTAEAAPADCNSGLSGNITQDATWSGDIYISGDVTVEGNTTLTISPGSRVLFCGNYRLHVGDLFSPGRLVAEGSAQQPITFTGADGQTRWNQLAFGDHLDDGPSVVRYALFENGGGTDAGSGYTIAVDDRSTVNGYNTPIFEHVTVRNSNGSGFDVNALANDPTPPQLIDVTVEQSALYPLEVDAAAVSGLMDVKGSGNYTDTIQVRGGSQGVMHVSQHWRRQGFPYEVMDSLDVSGGQSTWTIDPGVEMRMHPAAGILIGNLYDPARIVAKGTPTQPISITGATAGHWGQILFSDHLDQGPSVLQNMVIEDGGGSDPSQGQTIQVSDRAVNPDYHTPLIDHVTVRDSNGYGIRVEATGDDPKPAQLTHVTVEGSALAAVDVDVNAVTGIDPAFSASGNHPDHIRVFGGRMNYDSHWRNHGIPYELTGEFSIRSNYENNDVVPAVWTIDPGVTILVHPGQSVTVGSLYGEGQVMAKGTADDPITFTRLDENSAPWGGFNFDAYNNLDSEFDYVDLTYGGGVNGNRDAVIAKRGSSKVVLENVSIQHSQNGAIWIFGGSVWAKDSTITNNRYGIDVQARTTAKIRGSDLSGNAEFALNNGSPGRVCIDAVGNYWGPGGPKDTSGQEDACNSTRTNDGTGVVSDGVVYMPWQTATDGGGAFGAITPDQFWVIADGQESTQITVQLRDEQGQPLAGKQVTLQTTLGTLQQPTAPTDDNGETTGVISGTETGFATITAMNVTDGQPVAGTAGVNFWQGSGNFGGLVDPGGTPYASPALAIEGEPFQQGFPVEMRMPMQNTQSNPVDVQVVYGISGLGIGTRFTPVYTATRTLQPGEQWDAQGVWVPDVTGHHCIQAQLSYEDGQQRSVAETGGGTRQINTDENPCSGLASGPGDFQPDDPDGGPEDLKKVAKHFKDQTINLSDAIKCIKQEVSFAAVQAGSQGELRDYQMIVSVPQYTPPTVQADADVTQGQADALNALAQTSAQALGLSRAIAATRQRMQWAAQAGSLADLDRQYQAFLDFVAQYAQTLRTAADQQDDLLAVTEGAGVADAYFYPEDYQAAFDDLVQNGFSAGTLAFLQQSGMGQDLIDELRQDIIDSTTGRSFQTTSFYQTVRDTRDEARRIAEQLERQYGLNQAGASRAAASDISPEPQIFDFTVGHPFSEEKTVDLTIRPVSLPMDWSARLAKDQVTLGPGETMTDTLTVVPGNAIPETSRVRVAVEGSVDGEYVGGILFTYNAPLANGIRQNQGIYLPALYK